MFQHFIITKFNVPQDNWHSTRSGRAIEPEKWLKHRIEIFEQFCLPSVMAQNNMNFTWLLLVNTQDKPYFATYCALLEQKHQAIQCIETNNNAHALLQVQELVRASKASFIITTRLDNDDIISCDFVNSIQSTFVPQRCIVNLSKGLQGVLINGKLGQLRSYEQEFNPFISLIEPSIQAHTVMSRKHRAWHAEEKVINLVQKPQWIEIVHNNNRLNAERKHLPLVNVFDGYEFAVAPHQLHRLGIMKLIFLQLQQRLYSVKNKIAKS